MAQNRNNNRGRQEVQEHQPMTENEQITAVDKIGILMRDLNERGDELRPLLPPDLPLNAFLSVANQALRSNPDLLKCDYNSLVQAFVKGAYDGLRIDGVEAAIIPQKDKKLGTAALYMPMVRGLIKQILQSGAALSVKAVVVFKQEVEAGRFQLTEGTNPGIHHAPMLDLDHRTAEKVGVYAIAEIQPGVFKFEWLNKFTVLDIKAESKYGVVWDRWPTEMWKKSAVRRLRKSLVGTHRIIDMEAVELFPQFQQPAAHPQLAQPIPARPRRDTGALTDRSGSENGVAMHFGNGEQERQPVEHQQNRDQPKQQQAPAQEGPQIPQNDQEWAAWSAWFEKELGTENTVKGVNELVRGEQPLLDAAGKDRKDWLMGIVTERLADLASAAPDGSPPAEGSSEGRE